MRGNRSKIFGIVDTKELKRFLCFSVKFCQQQVAVVQGDQGRANDSRDDVAGELFFYTFPFLH